MYIHTCMYFFIYVLNVYSVYTLQVVFYAAVFRAVQNLKVFDAEVESALSMGQLGPLREMVPRS